MPYPPNPYWCIEILRHDIERGAFRSALFDFDGTVSLIRQGWQEVMVPYFADVLQASGGERDRNAAVSVVTEFIERLTGKQTIYQCMRLAEEVERRGGSPLPALEYKEEYHRRLMVHISGRRRDLSSGRLDPEEMLVPGAVQFLKGLRDRGVVLYLASGTDERFVLEEAYLLGVDGYFSGGIFGAQDDYRLFSKAMVIQQIINKHNLRGDELVGFGDGFVEIENVKSAGGLAIGVATDEARRTGLDAWKRLRLVQAGADAIVPDLRDTDALLAYLFPRDP